MESDIKVYGTIYVITNSVNNKVYVGQTTAKLEKRFREHFRGLDRRRSKLVSAIKSHGQDKFKIQAIDFANDQDELNRKEIEWISRLNSVEDGYNLKLGGQNGGKASEELRLKFSNMNKGRKASPESCRKRARYGKDNHFYGKVPTEQHRKKVSETKRRNGDAVGSKNPFYGKKQPDHVKKFLSEYFTKKVVITAKDAITGEISLTFTTYKELESWGFDESTVRKCDKGKMKTYRGFHWSIEK